MGRGQEGAGEPLGHGAAMDGAHCATAAGQCRAPPSPAQSREQISALPHKPPPKRLAEVPALGNQPWGVRVQKLAPSRALDSTGRGGAASRRLQCPTGCSAQGQAAADPGGCTWQGEGWGEQGNTQTNISRLPRSAPRPPQACPGCPVPPSWSPRPPSSAPASPCSPRLWVTRGQRGPSPLPAPTFQSRTFRFPARDAA